jgi:DNA-binding Lrp family transcriptional regulator
MLPSDKDKTRILKLTDQISTSSNKGYTFPRTFAVAAIARRLKLAPARAERLVKELVVDGRLEPIGFQLNLADLKRNFPIYINTGTKERWHAERLAAKASQ